MSIRKSPRFLRPLVRSMPSKFPSDHLPNGKAGFFNGQSLWEKVQSSLSFFPTWKPSSETLLVQSEKLVLDKEVQSSYTDHYVPVSRSAVIRTIVMEPEVVSSVSSKEETPLVMVHGFGTGLLQFYKNLDHLHTNRRLLALDLPGFGRSSRVTFPKDPKGAEEQFVEMMEKWRQRMGVGKFVLLGHSLGGYLATAYSLKYPDRVRHLILVDPWGFQLPPPEEEMMKNFSRFQAFTWQVLSHLRPFTAVRAAGPWGPDIVKKMRKDLVKTFGDPFIDYVYHCNAGKPTGEEAFYNMQYYFAWARRPMLGRISSHLNPGLPITVICGSKSWIDAVNKRYTGRTADLIREARPEGSYVGVAFLEAGHHLHAEKPQAFNQIVREVLEVVDRGEDQGGCGLI